MIFNEIITDSEFVAYNLDQLPKEVLKQCDGEFDRRGDLVTGLSEGVDWLFELTRKYQPRTGNILTNSECFIFGYKTDSRQKSYLFHLATEINDQVVCIGRQFRGYNPSDYDYQKNIEKTNTHLTNKWGKTMITTERYLSLPEPIRMAYYYRFDGLNVPLTSSVGIYSRLLPFPIMRPWDTIDNYLAGVNSSNKLSLINDIFPDAQPKKKSSPYINLMIFLDTRPNLSGKQGDIFFIKNHIQDGIIYYIKDADVDNLMILSEPIEALDRYCEHILLRKEGIFNFLPYASKI